MRVLHILDHSLPLHSGYAFRTQAILRHQRAMGWETYQLTSPKHRLDAPAKETVDGLEFYRTPQTSGFWSRLPVLGEVALMSAIARRLNEVVREAAPEILHAHSPVLNAIPALWTGSRRDIPVVYEVRASWEDAAVSHGTTQLGGVRYKLSRALETFAIRRADAVTTICEGIRNELIARGIAPDKITVIPNAVDVEQFDGSQGYGAELADALGLAGKTVLAFIGSFYAYEGLDLLIRALPGLLESEPDIRLLLVGGGPEDARLKGLATTLGVTEQTVFTGRIPHDQVPAYYDLADIMIYPRRLIRLTELVTPLKPLEAMAQRKIVVASDVGGHRELIRDGDTGFLFQADDVDDLAATVLRVLDDRASWPRQLARARRFVESERTWANSVARYTDVYAGILSARKRDRSAEGKAQTAG